MVLPPDERPCLWMSAGLVSYKLCDRQMDCGRCPLDAALRGEPTVPRDALARHLGPRWVFPADRRYTPGHLWVRPLDGRLRVGLDALAVAIIGVVGGRHAASEGAALLAGGVAGRLECRFGPLRVRAPLEACLVRWNPALDEQPDLCTTAPYGDGWLFELAPAAGWGDRTDLLSAPAIRHRAELDVRRFRRQVGMLLLSGLDAVGATLADGGIWLSDVAEMIGHGRYLALVEDLLA